MTLPDRDRDILIRTIIGEAANEGPEGWAGVAHTIRNRSKDPRWPSGVADVSLQPKQFSAWNKGAGGNHLVHKYGPDSGVYQNVGKIADQVFAGEYADPTGGATHYYSPAGMKALVNSGAQSNVLPRWLQQETDRRGGNTTTIGGHIFTGLASGATPQTPNPHPPLAKAPPLGQSSPANDPTPMLMALFGGGGSNTAVGNSGVDALPSASIPAPQPTPMKSTAPAPVQGNTAALAPTVAEGNGMAKTVSTTLAPTPQQIEQRRAMARSLQDRSDAVEVIRHPTQGLAKVANAAAASFKRGQADRMQKRRSEALAGVIGGMADTQTYSQQQIAQAAALDPRLGMEMVSANRARDAQIAKQQQKANQFDIIEFYDDDTGRMRKAKQYGDGRIEPLGGVKSDMMSEGAVEQKKDIAASGKTTINNTFGHTDKFREESDKALAQHYGELGDAGLKAESKLRQVDRLEFLLTNSPQGAEGAIKQFLGEFGVETEGLDALQAANALLESMVPAQRPPGSGPMSDADIAMFRASLPRLINTPAGNALIINTMRGMAQYEVEIGGIADMARFGEVSPKDARKMMSEVVNPMEGFRELLKQQKASDEPQIPEGVDPELWDLLPAEDKQLWQN